MGQKEPSPLTQSLDQAVTARLTYDGTVIANEDVYSIETYAYNKTKKDSTADEKLKALCWAMMKYGKSARAYFGK